MAISSLLFYPLAFVLSFVLSTYAIHQQQGHLQFDLTRPRTGDGVRKGLDTFRLHAPQQQQQQQIGDGGTAATAAEEMGLGGHELLDVVLLATVDGKFHALNRTTGMPIWSMGDEPKSTFASPEDGEREKALLPLIRSSSKFLSSSSSSDPDSEEETYIVEPQTGSIFVLPAHSTPSTPLQKLSFTLPQLVDMSPHALSEERMFVARKETRLLVVELESGRVRDIIDVDRCNWDSVPGGDGEENESQWVDDPKEDEPPPRKKTEIYIGRTDYELQIISYSSPSSSSSSRRKRKLQTLVYSSYGPNTLHKPLQASYTRTLDSLYVTARPSGEVYAFSLKDSDKEIDRKKWGIDLGESVVATFDVLVPPSIGLDRDGEEVGRNPFILEQPTPHITQILPGRPMDRSGDLSVDGDYGWIGLVEGSLYVMGNEDYPLAIFGDRARKLPRIDGGGAYGYSYSLDTDQEDAECLTAECLVGLRQRDRSGTSYVGGLNFTVGGYIDAAPTSSSSSAPLESPTTTREPDTYKETVNDRAPWWRMNTVTTVDILGTLFALALGVWAALRYWTSVSPTPVAVGFHQNQHQIPEIVIFPPASEPSTPIPEVNFEMEPVHIKEPVRVDPEPIGKAETSDEYVVIPSRPPPVANPEKSLPTPAATEEDEEKKKKNRTRSRAKKKKAAFAREVEEREQEKEVERKAAERVIERVVVEIESEKRLEPVQPVSSLIVSEEVLGFGSHGTMVFKGSFQGRAVAVKRLLHDFVTLASREVTLLQESDAHPNVIRYYFQEARHNFLYIALELCPASLADVVERPDTDAFREISCAFDPKRALNQITAGLRWLHGLKIVHRDIKPQNILVAESKSRAATSGGKGAQFRMLISDFGLCKKLGADETSFLPTVHGAMAAGTVGWRAPEILRGEVKLDDSSLANSDDTSQSSRGSVGTVNGSTTSNDRNRTRLTKAVDIFALGCLFYYTLTSGGHPYGDRYEREGNIMKDAKDLSGLDPFGEEGVEACDLIGKMLDPESRERPDTGTVLLHPFFWNPGRRLTFFQDASDRFEIMTREPRDVMLCTLERGAEVVVGRDWHSRLDRTFIENLGKFRKYDGRSVQDLLRALRNKKHHYQDLPENVKRHLGPLPEGFLNYFTLRFPALFLHVYYVISESNLSSESMFRSYFELADS